MLPDALDPLSRCADVDNLPDLESEERRLRRRLFKQRQYELRCVSSACFEHLQCVWLHAALLHDLELVNKMAASSGGKMAVPMGCTKPDFPILDSTPAILKETARLDPRCEHVAEMMTLHADVLRCYAEELRAARDKVEELTGGVKKKKGCCAAGAGGGPNCVVQ